MYLYFYIAPTLQAVSRTKEWKAPLLSHHYKESPLGFQFGFTFWIATVPPFRSSLAAAWGKESNFNFHWCLRLTVRSTDTRWFEKGTFNHPQFCEIQSTVCIGGYLSGFLGIRKSPLFVLSQTLIEVVMVTRRQRAYYCHRGQHVNQLEMHQEKLPAWGKDFKHQWKGYQWCLTLMDSTDSRWLEKGTFSHS